MANAALIESADCLRDLGRYDEAAAAYEEAIRAYEQLNDPRSVAAGKGQLADVRRRQKNCPEALPLYGEVQEVFERLNEPATAAGTWHQIGMVYSDAGQFDASEQAYQNSLRIWVRIDDRGHQSMTLTELGNLCARTGRPEEAVRLYRQCAEINTANRDLRNEGIDRSNIAVQLIQLGRYDDARAEIKRAIECKKPFGHVAEPWKTFGILCDIERAVGHEPAALAARRQALDAYLAYRRQGDAPQIDVSKIPPGLTQPIPLSPTESPPKSSSPTRKPTQRGLFPHRLNHILLRAAPAASHPRLPSDCEAC